MILQVITDTDRRGAQVFATDLARAMGAQGESVRTVALTKGSDTQGLDVQVLGPSRLSAATLGGLRELAREASVVVAHGSTTLYACAITSLLTRTPFVYRQISDVVFWTPSASRRLRVRLALHRAAAVVALWGGSASVVGSRFGLPADRITVIPNGVDGTQFAVATEAERRRARADLELDVEVPTVVAIGALVPEKGVDLVIEAMSGLERGQLLVVGDGPERGKLEQQAREQLGARVRFAGWLPSAVPAYQAADVVVLASRGGDSMPAVLIEAGLSGVPVVSTPVEAIPEVVADGVTGRIVEARADSVRAAIAMVVQDRANAQAMGVAARERCLERYELSVVARRWSDLLSEVARRG